MLLRLADQQSQMMDDRYFFLHTQLGLTSRTVNNKLITVDLPVKYTLLGHNVLVVSFRFHMLQGMPKLRFTVI